MKKALAIIALGLFLGSQAQAQDNPIEMVRSIEAKISINSDSTVSVREDINYDFGDSARHGIFRYIPYKYTRNGINYNLVISDISVTDYPGTPYEFSVRKRDGNYEIKIGDPDVYVNGIKDYIIQYKVRGAINYFSDHDEFYWNVVGAGWTVPILGRTANIKLPPGGQTQSANADCFSGPQGSTSKCQNTIAYGDSYAFVDSGTGPFTVVVGFPKGLVHEPSRWEVLKHTIQDNLIFLLPILTLIGMWWFWLVGGRDPKPSIPMVAQYEAPDKLTPVEVGFLADDRTQNSDISAEIIYLATLGYLRIERIPKKGMFGKEDFRLTRLKNGDDLPNEFDRNLLKVLFALGPDEVLLSALRKKAKPNAHNFRTKIIAEKLTGSGYYTKNPRTMQIQYLVAAGIIILFAIIYLSSLVQWSVTVSVILSGIIIGLFGYFMPRKTQKGADTYQLILGLKEYLSVAEKDRLDFHNDPAKDPKIFEKLLPYAMALGVSDAWAKKFEGVFDYHPDWYVDPAHASFNMILFSHAMSDFRGDFASTAIAAASSGAGSGSSGFGGGFSGGGFGGGGGGSW